MSRDVKDGHARYSEKETEKGPAIGQKIAFVKQVNLRLSHDVRLVYEQPKLEGRRRSTGAIVAVILERMP